MHHFPTRRPPFHLFAESVSQSLQVHYSFFFLLLLAPPGWQDLHASEYKSAAQRSSAVSPAQINSLARYPVCLYSCDNAILGVI